MSAHGRYLAALRRTLHLSTPGANLSVEVGGALVARSGGLTARKLLLQVPPRHVVTVQEALGAAGSVINRCALKLPKTLPRHFVLGVFVLYERHAGRKDGLWRLWLESLPPLDNATFFWSDEQLQQLEEERAIKRSRELRRVLHDEYRTMVRVLLDEGLDDDMPDGVEIGVGEYMWAVGVVMRYAWHFGPDFPVLVPLALRQHPEGNAVVVEWGNETDPGASLYVSEHAPRALPPGAEVTAWAESADPLEQLLHAGHVWDALPLASLRLHFSAGGLKSAETPGGGGRTARGEGRRKELLAAAQWSTQMDFELAHRELNPELLAWLRLVLATDAELAAAATHAAFDEPDAVSADTERRVWNALLYTLESSLGAYDFDVEEDEEWLRASERSARTSAAPASSASLTAAHRKHIAVTYRRLCKRVLLRNQEMASAALKVAHARRRHRPADSATPVSVAVSPTGEATTEPTRKRTATRKKKRRKKVQ